MIALVFCMVAFHRYVHFGSQDLEGGNIYYTPLLLAETNASVNDEPDISRT